MLELHESNTWALKKINGITDRETFVGIDEFAAGMKSNAAEFGVDMAKGGLSHKREMASYSATTRLNVACDRILRSLWKKHTPDENLPALLRACPSRAW